jgi:hypothetical protein
MKSKSNDINTSQVFESTYIVLIILSLISFFSHDNASSRDSDHTQKALDGDVAEASARIRDLVRAVRHSGAIDEVSTAVHEAVIAVVLNVR